MGGTWKLLDLEKEPVFVEVEGTDNLGELTMVFRKGQSFVVSFRSLMRNYKKRKTTTTSSDVQNGGPER